MLILGIETATQQVSVAIGGHEGVLGMFEVSRGRRHAETLVPAIEFLCRQTDIEISEFGAIAVDIGPGLFTGMRVGLAAGKAIAQALRVPMIGISSLDLLAFPKAKDKQVRHFSSGMKQRLKLALATCSASSLLLLDEPTTNLDAQGVDWYLALVERFIGHRTVVVASNVAISENISAMATSVRSVNRKSRERL